MRTPPARYVLVLLSLLLLDRLGASDALAAPRKGQLVVITEPPGASVTIDGVGVGRSPVTVKDLLRGKHLVEATAASGQKAQVIAEVVPDESVLVTVKLPAAAPPPRPPAEESPTSPPEPAAPGDESASPPAEPEAPAELSANAPALESIHREQDPIKLPGFPALIQRFSAGARFDLLIIAAAASEGLAKTGVVGGRFRLEGYLGPMFTLGLDIYAPIGAVGPSFAFNLPRWLPFGPTSRLAMMPRVGLWVLFPEDNGIMWGCDLEAQAGFAIIRNLVAFANFGFSFMGMAPLKVTPFSPYVGGFYFGVLMGGGLRWAF